jgi:phosphate transport system permease protein
VTALKTEPAETAELPSAPSAEPDERPRALHVRTTDEILSLVGAGVASLALAWLVYEQLLPFSGVVGFVLCWWAAFVALYAGLTALSNPAPLVKERLASAIVQSGAAVVGGALLSTVAYIFIRGWTAYTHWNFYVQDMAGIRPTDPLSRGGCWHAIVGSAIQIVISVGISMPLGIATAVYMTEVGGRLSRIVRTVVEAMTALPDILAGLFIYTVLIIGFHWERTGLTVALALSVTMVPIVARAAEVVLRVVPGGLREAGIALGASQWQTVRRVVLPTARSGLVTALILGIARVAGETAPLLIVSASTTFFNANPLHNPMDSLPLYIFVMIRDSDPHAEARGYGAASLLLALAILLFVLARYLARDKVRGR